MANAAPGNLPARLEAQSTSQTTSPANPQNHDDYSVFQPQMRTYLTYLLGVILLLSTLTATIYFPLIPMLSAQFSVSIQAINLTVTVYAVCQAVSPAFFAAVADAHGRRPVLLGLIALYSAATLGLTLNRRSYAALIALRALQSLGGSATVPVSYGIVADLAVPSERGGMLGPMLATCNAISAVGPVIGGAIALGTSGFRWVFFALLIVAVACFVLVGFTVPETARAVVGNGSVPATGVWRTWISYLPGKMDKHMNGEGKTLARVGEKKPSLLGLKTLSASFRIILYPDAAAVLWMVASSYSVYYTFQVAIPVIFAEIYSYNELQIGLGFLPGLAGMTIGGILAGKFMDRNYAITAKKHNIEVDRKKGESMLNFPLEEARYRRCLLSLSAMVLLVVGYGWAVHYRAHPAVPIAMQFSICALSTLLSHPASALLVDIFPDQSSSAYAAGQIMRCGLSAASAAVIQPLTEAVGRAWYFTMFAIFVGGSGLGAVVVSRANGMTWRQSRLRPLVSVTEEDASTKEISDNK